VFSAIQLYEKATVDRLNPKNSKALAIGRWTAPATVFGIEFCTHVKILGVTFGTTIENSMKESSACVIRAVRAQAQKAYARNLSRTVSAICAAKPISKNLERVADASPPQSAYETVDNSTHLLHLTGRHLPRNSYPKEKR
jgi:hypothetical protein